MEAMEKVPNKVGKTDKDAKVSLENYKFSFEKIPENAAWYNTFQRIDRGEQRYTFFSDHYFWDPFILPYQMPTIAPLDPKICMSHYSQLMKYIRDPPSETDSTGCSTPDLSGSVSTPSPYQPDVDEDSKMSAATVSSTCSAEEPPERKRRGRRPRALIQQATSGKNPRKSPRQHASTLAILSSLIQQRKRRSRNRLLEDSLPTIPEEEGAPQVEQSPAKTKTPPRRFKPKIDYFSVAQQIDEELDTAWGDDELDELEIDPEENRVEFSNGGINVAEILRLYEEGKSKEDERSCRRFFNGTPGRKPGRRKKKNKTGWPNKNKRLSKKGQERDKDEDDSTIESASVDSDEELTDGKKEEEEEEGGKSAASKDQNERVDKVLTNKVTNRTEFQPYVCVEKLDGDKLLRRQAGTPKRSTRRQRRMPGSPKSPRMLRKPRGRWYRER